MLELLRSLLLSPRRMFEYNGETPEKTGFLVGSGKLFRGHERWMSKRQIRKKHPKVCLCPGSSIYLNCLNAHTLEHICADSVVVITRRCQRLNPGSSPGRRTQHFHEVRWLFFNQIEYPSNAFPVLHQNLGSFRVFRSMFDYSMSFRLNLVLSP